MDRANHTALRMRQRKALLAASAMALVFAVAPDRARGQDYSSGFQGSGVVNAGSAVITPTTNTTTVDVTSPRTVITWTPTSTATSGTIDFLPTGTAANFTSFNQEDYTVLNRILPGGSAKIGLNGSITSTINQSESSAVGGNLWFYTPNGFVIGGGAVISVGGLLLTTNDIGFSTDANGGVSFGGANGAVNMRGPVGSTGSIVNNGTITASSYVAMVAPRVEQRGIVRAGRSIAYVAGEEVDLTIDNGMFGITVLTGTTDSQGIVHTNTTGGSASAGSFDSKTISFVAIPKNEAMTMLLSGSIGYDPAASVFNDGASIVLTAGDATSPAANIRIGAGEFTSGVNARATGDLTVAPDPPGPFAEGSSNTVFRSFTDLTGEVSVRVTAASNTRVQADNGLMLRSGNDDRAGTIDVEAFGGGFSTGTIAVIGTLEAIAEHSPDSSTVGDIGKDAQGGSIGVRANGGVIVADSLYLSANGEGGRGNLRGGNGTGGSIDLSAGLGGSVTTSSVSLYATGHGGEGYSFEGEQFVPGQGGVGRGGSITITDSVGDRTDDPDGGTLNLGSLYLSSSAVGGNSGSFRSGTGGDAFGGSIDLLLDRQDFSASGIYGYATARDGDSAVDPIGGDITMTVGGGITVDLEQLYLDASASSGVNGPDGAFARGGTIDLSAIEDSTLRTEFSLNLISRADTAFFFGEGLPSSTVDLTGGDVTMTADGGTIEAGFVRLDVGAYNYGAVTRAGFAQGGTAAVTAANGGIVATRAQDGEGTPSFEISADAYAGAGVAVGESRGGKITLAALSGGTIAAPGINIVLEAAGETGLVSAPETSGAPAVGGAIAIDAIGGAITAPIEAYAFGEGGTADLSGGSGTGGSIDVRVLEGGVLTGSLLAQAYGRGGASLIEGDGGDGLGGSFTLTSDALAGFTAFSIDFQGYGEGGQAAGGAGGNGYGGTADVDVLGGESDWSYAIFNVSAGGAESQGVGSLAGSSFGDGEGVQFDVGGGASLSIGELVLDATAYADSNGDGNQAIGGSAGVLVDGGASLTADSIVVGASGYLRDFSFDPSTTDSTPTVRGGTASLVADGGSITSTLIEVVADGDTAGALTSGGSATGGTATAGAANGGSILLDLNFGCEGLCFGGLYVHADGNGGEGPSAANAFGGTATLYTQGGTITSPYNLEVSADASAGSYAGFFGEFGIPSNGFDATGGTASVEMRAGGSGSGSIAATTLAVSAQGRADALGSVAGNGGKGTGGTATLSIAEGDLSVDFGLSVSANGYGGSASENEEGAEAFAGGDGESGTATFALSGGIVTAPSVRIEAEGVGANGEGFNAGATPSLAGDGQGGSAAFRASGGTLLTLGDGDGGEFFIGATGFGGQGAFNPNGGAGGTGGNGTGGNALFEAPTGSSALLTILPPINLVADGIGGGGGSSSSQTSGTGGNGRGGSAAMRLADIALAFDHVFISGSGSGGFGGTSGVGDGGSAEFSLIDSGSAAMQRSLGLLTLQATGLEYSGTPSGAGGTLTFNARAGSPDAGLAIEGDLLLDARGATAPLGNGFVGSISGAPVTVGGIAQLYTPRDAILAVTAPGALVVTGDLTVDVGRTFTSTGSVSTLANSSVVAPGGISMAELASGGTTLLSAANGPVTVSSNLLSGGLVTVLGRSVNLVSLGSLSFADADATAGDLAIRTAGDLDLVTADGTGAVTLTSTAGDIHNTGRVKGVGITYVAFGNVVSDTTVASDGALTVDAGGTFTAPGTVSAIGNVSLSADLGLALSAVTSGGTTLLQADAGDVAVGSLTSPGLVTAVGRSVTLASPGALSFANAQATSGNLQISTAGNLSVAQGGAAGTVLLTSTGGSVSGAGPIVAGGAVQVNGATGIALGTLTSGGSSLLLANAGAVSVANLNSAGLVTARGTAVTIGSTGALSFADLDATAGNVDVRTVGDLAVSTVDATGSITLISSSGSLAASGALNGVGITLSSFSNLTLSNALATSGAISLTSTNGAVSSSSSVTAGGSLAVSGLTGISLGTAGSGGTTTLSAANGTVSVSALTPAGPVTASGRAVSLGSTASLNVASAQATSGNLALTAAQGLTVGTATATGTVTLAPGGNLTTSGPITGAGISLSGANVSTGGPVQSSGALALTAQQLLTINAPAAGTTMNVTSGDITIGSTGRLGSRGLTQTLRITNQSASTPINFGGSGTSGQFSLDQAEAARLFADQSITIAARSAEGGGGDIRVGALAMSYGAASSANIGNGGTLKVDTAGNVTVNGAVALATSSAEDTFSIDPQRIEVIAGSGSIAMLGSGGTPLGRLILEGGTIVIADQSLISAIGSASDITTIKQLLDQPTATPSDNGLLQAGSIDLRADDGVYIQNTGASTANNARRGFTAGAVNIDTGSSSTQIVINGVISGPSGTLTGRLAAGAITINGAPAAPGGAFDSQSTINGCIIGSACTTLISPTNSDLNSPIANDLGNPGLSGELVQFGNNEPLLTPPLVDEPITGVGNDDLWKVHCDPEGDKGDCPAEGSAEGETPE